jgi:hypothetical protein
MQKGHSMTRLSKSLWSALLALAVLTLQSLALADKPRVIRVGYPGGGTANRPASFGNAVATLHLKGLLEEEFKKDGGSGRERAVRQWPARFFAPRRLAVGGGASKWPQVPSARTLLEPSA